MTFLPIHYNLHWSLLCVANPFETERQGTALYVVDSRGSHHDVEVVAKKLIPLLKKKTKQVVMRKHSGRFQVVQVATKPQQENDNDCGIYVLHYLQVIRNVVEANGVDYFANHVGSICRGFTAEMCRRDRKELLTILNS
jgi:Ulp1 family protease